MMMPLSLLPERDIHEDKRTGITTLAILLGYRMSRYLYFFMVIMADIHLKTDSQPPSLPPCFYISIKIAK